MGKGSNQRPTNLKAYRESYDRIFTSRKGSKNVISRTGKKETKEAETT